MKPLLKLCKTPKYYNRIIEAWKGAQKSKELEVNAIPSSSSLPSVWCIKDDVVLEVDRIRMFLYIKLVQVRKQIQKRSVQA